MIEELGPTIPEWGGSPAKLNRRGGFLGDDSGAPSGVRSCKGGVLGGDSGAPSGARSCKFFFMGGVPLPCGNIIEPAEPIACKR